MTGGYQHRKDKAVEVEEVHGVDCTCILDIVWIYTKTLFLNAQNEEFPPKSGPL